MLEKAIHMTIAEMRDQYDFIMEILRIPEIPVAEKICKIDYWDYQGIRATRREEERIDAEMAEFYADHDDRKAHVRNRRKADRKHKMTPKMRKEQEWMRNWNICGKYMNCGWTLVNDARDAESERFARNDWEIEKNEIAESEMWKKINADIARENQMRKLNDWLKYA